MTKSANILPNLRIDKEDFNAQSVDYTRNSFKLFLERAVQDNFAGIADGFRVEIANQSVNPGTFTVFNGVAFDRSGQILINEDEYNASRSYTLSVNGTYYVEVRYTEAESDVDQRAFWDPSYDNGADPSGDERTPGREFSQNVATRLAPDWEIVTPISTTGFESTSNKNSVKIPVAIITRSGGTITGATTVPARTVLAKAAVIGDTSVTGLDTRLMPDAFSLRIKLTPASGGETVTVVSNDRENGILSLSSALTTNQPAGTVLSVNDASPSQFLTERIDPDVPTSGTEDARTMLFRGNENKGFILTRNPNVNDGGEGDKSDVEIKTLKRYIDMLAAQIREIKFGAQLDADIGQLTPPRTFPVSPRYYDFSGGLQGARTNTASIGDGTATSWGDYNTVQIGNVTTTFQNAIDDLGGAGGILYVKRGPYFVSTTSVLVDAPVTFVGDGPEASLITAFTSGVPSFTVTSDHVRFNNLYLSSGVLVSSGATNVVFENCKFVASSTHPALLVTNASNIRVINCEFTLAQDEVAIELDSDCSDLVIEGCTFTQGTTGGSAIGTGVRLLEVNNVSINNCVFNDLDIGIRIGQALNANIHNCKFLTPTAARGKYGIAFSGTAPSLRRSTITNCIFDDLDLAGTEVAGINFYATGDALLNYVSISGCKFTNLGTSSITNVYGINIAPAGALAGVTSISISDCSFDTIIGENTYGVYFSEGTEVSITNNKFSLCATAGTGSFFLIDIDDANNSVITGNAIASCGNSSNAGSICSGILVGAESATAQPARIVISNNNIYNLTSAGSSVLSAIRVSGAAELVSIANNTITLSSFVDYGILVRSTTTGGNDISEVGITGNIISSSIAAIAVELADTTTYEEGNINITGNVLKNFEDYAVYIAGSDDAGTDNTRSLVICGNNMQSSSQSVAIYIIDFNVNNISNNTIILSNTGGPNNAIYTNTGRGIICGNMIRSEAASGDTIELEDAGAYMISGNHVLSASSGNTIDLGTNQYCVSNYFENTGGGTQINITGTNTYTRGLDDAENLDTIPEGTTDIGLNYRTT